MIVPSLALQTVGLVKELVKLGFGFTVTVTVNGVPAQLPKVGVTVYVAVCAVFVGFIKVPVILVAPVPEAPPVIAPVTVGADQLYVVPVGTTPFVVLTGVELKATPLQTVVVIAVMAGFGLAVTVTVNGVPAQLPEVGVTVYVAVCAVFVAQFALLAQMHKLQKLDSNGEPALDR